MNERYEVKERDDGLFCVIDAERMTVLDGPFALECSAEEYASHANSMVEVGQPIPSFEKFRDQVRPMWNRSRMTGMES